MLFDRRLVSGLAGLCVASTANAVCTSNLLIDNFAKWSAGTNSLGSQNGDDGSMTSIAANNGAINFTPKGSDSYFYESLKCQTALTNGYGGIQFNVNGPAGGSVAVEVQTASNCNSTTTFSRSYNVVSDLSGRNQLVQLPWEGFDNSPNADSIVGFSWSEFVGNGQWTIANVSLICGGVTPSTTPTTSTPTPPPTPACSNVLVDDWESQSRLTFLGYNALNQSSGDDGTMASITVNSHRVMLVPQDTDSYFFSQFGCFNAGTKYGGMSMRVRAARGTRFTVSLYSSSKCGQDTGTAYSKTTTQLNWQFDGTERLYYFPFSVFQGLDVTNLQQIYFSGLNNAIILGPISFYCGSTASEYVPPATPVGPAQTATTPRVTASNPVSTAKAFLIDTFDKKDTNALGQWHGGDDGMTVSFISGGISISTNDSDLGWNTQLGPHCSDLSAYKNAYLHIAYSGSSKFSVAMQQHNPTCNESISPYPETWDSLEAARYASARDIYMPIAHFNINHTRAVGFNLRGFYTTQPTQITKIEIVDSPPTGWKVPDKLPSGRLIFSCTRPNSFAFAIDDGEPKYAQQIMDTVKQAGIPVTFFTVGLPLLDKTTNLSNIYRDMAARGHQIAMHSYTHPKMEGLPDEASIDWEYTNDIGAVKQVFNGAHTNYFRPPFGTEGARMRQRLAAALNDPKPNIVQWSIDVEDWIWAETKTPEKQLDAFKRDLAKGGNLVVMHYLYNSTVNYLPEFIRLAKATGKRLMRVDQCMEDPNAPPLT
ncbi:glycoside hydrolase/deacetylase [Thozetella sp. PMI_491]|nr:glycoside hydrolase/deacetylase [Thozetella sp. PMI_491]